MNKMTTAKLALAAISIILFAVGIRTDSSGLRWAAIAFLVAAFLLRFIKASRVE